MTIKDKRLKRLFQNAKDIRFSDLNAILIDLGYVKRQSGKVSSHYIYSHSNIEILVVLVSHGKNDKLPEYQVKKAIRSIKKLMEAL